MQPVRAFNGSFNFMGRRLPNVVGALIVATVVLSVFGVILMRAGVPLVTLGILSVDGVWQGELWRLVTWVFFELNPIGLVFGCLCLWWFGTDLTYAWGPQRFLALYLGLGALAGGLTCLIARVTGSGFVPGAFAGNAAVVAALIIAWATFFPQRQILVYFIFPLGGRNLIYLTVGLTLLFGLYGGFGGVLPELLAEAMMLAYVREPTLHRLWLRLRLNALQRSARRRPGHLRPVDEDRDRGGPRWYH
jgi:membrane associated rhomboid family serine protease